MCQPAHSPAPVQQHPTSLLLTQFRLLFHLSRLPAQFTNLHLLHNTFSSYRDEKIGDPILCSSLPGLEQWHILSVQQLWSEFKDAQDSDVTGAESQIRLSVREDAAWREDGASGLGATHSEQHVQLVRRTFLGVTDGKFQPRRPDPELHQVFEAGAWLVEGANSPLSDWDADLTRTAVQHRLRIPFLTRTRSAPCPAKSLTVLVTMPSVLALGSQPKTYCGRPCLPRSRPGSRPSALERDSRPAPAQTPTDSLEAATTDPPTSGYPMGRTWSGEAWDCAVSSCLRPATRNRGPTTPSTQNPAEDETLGRTLHDTANRRHQAGLRFNPVVSGGHAGVGDSAPQFSSPGSPSVSEPPLTALQASSLSNFLSAPLRHCIVTPRVAFCDVSAWQPREGPLRLWAK